jgi:hypothetical protein
MQQQQKQQQQKDIIHTLIIASFSVQTIISWAIRIPRKEDATFHDHTKHLNMHA